VSPTEVIARLFGEVPIPKPLSPIDGCSRDV
jgi:hypothetical protein